MAVHRGGRLCFTVVLASSLAKGQAESTAQIPHNRMETVLHQQAGVTRSGLLYHSSSGAIIILTLPVAGETTDSQTTINQLNLKVSHSIVGISDNDVSLWWRFVTWCLALMWFCGTVFVGRFQPLLLIITEKVTSQGCRHKGQTHTQTKKMNVQQREIDIPQD